MPSEKRERIERMLDQEKTWDEIMKEVHVGPHTIKKVQDAVLAVGSSAICRTIAANPQSMALFSDPTATETLALFFLDPGPPGNEIWISKTANSIMEANIVILMNGILLGTINTLGDKKFASDLEKVKAEMAQFMILRKHHPLISSMFEN